MLTDEIKYVDVPISSGSNNCIDDDVTILLFPTWENSCELDGAVMKFYQMTRPSSLLFPTSNFSFRSKILWEDLSSCSTRKCRSDQKITRSTIPNCYSSCLSWLYLSSYFLYGRERVNKMALKIHLMCSLLL